MRKIILPIVLASTSPRRNELMKLLGLKFKIVASKYEEDMTLKMPPKKLVAHLAFGKARSVFKKYPNCVVIGADTIVVARGKVLGKPKSDADAKRMLALESNSKVMVYSAVAVFIPNRAPIVEVDTATVTFRGVSQKEIKNYVATGEPLEFAGGFPVQGRAAVFIKKINGQMQSVLGLPLYNLARTLENLGYTLWSEK